MSGRCPPVAIILPRESVCRWQLELAECFSSSWPGGAHIELARSATQRARRWPGSRLTALEELPPPADARPVDATGKLFPGIVIDVSGTEEVDANTENGSCLRLRLWSLDGDLALQGIPFLSEILRGERVTSVMLMAHPAGDKDKLSALGVGWWRTVPDRYFGFADRLLNELPHAVLRTLLACDWSGSVGPRLLQDNAPGFTFESRRTGLLDPLRAIAGIVRGLVARLWQDLFQHEQWTIGISEAPIAAFLDEGPKPVVHWWKPGPRAVYLADPFGIRCGERWKVLAEHFDYREGKGTIVELDADSATRDVAEIVTSLALPTHLSYPYVFRHEGMTFAVPENFEGGSIRLYRLSGSERLQWTETAVLVPGFAGVDATLFQWQGVWWMFATDRDAGADSHLYAWYAPSPAGPWASHVLNPIKIDVRGARPGGTPFIHEGRLFRPTQDCSRTYGGRIVLMEVARLDPEGFQERIAGEVRPGNEVPWQDGLHTLSACGDGRTLLDAKRVVFSPWACYRAIRHILARLGGLVRRPG